MICHHYNNGLRSAAFSSGLEMMERRSPPADGSGMDHPVSSDRDSDTDSDASVTGKAKLVSSSLSSK